VLVRAIGQFAPDNHTLSLYHCNGDLNDAMNQRNSPTPAGDPAFFADTGAFSKAVNADKIFQLDLPDLPGDFTIEFWIKPGESATPINIFSGNPKISIIIYPDDTLAAILPPVQLKSTTTIDRNVWQHVAISRKDGKVRLYINGLPVSGEVAFTEPIPGALKRVNIGPIPGGNIDEIRISDIRRTETVRGKELLALPVIPDFRWKIFTTDTLADTAQIYDWLWNAPPLGQLSFQVTSPIGGYAMINFVHTKSDSEMWSKNSDPMFFKTPDPVAATIRILNMDSIGIDTVVAGDTFLVEATLFNTEQKPYPGVYCYPDSTPLSKTNFTSYQDYLGQGGAARPEPIIIIDGVMFTLIDSTQNRASQCFYDGKSYMKTVVYYAPSDPDSMQQIFGNFGIFKGAPLRGESDKFVVVAGDLAAITIHYSDETPVTGKITLQAPDETVTLISIGWDEFGNRIGRTPANWTSDEGNLHDPAATNTDRMVYQSDDVIYTEAGKIKATSALPGKENISATVDMEITGLPTSLVSAKTVDNNGNGYLDGIELHFSRKISFPSTYTVAELQTQFTVEEKENTQLTFTVQGINQPGGIELKNDSVYTLMLQEDSSKTNTFIIGEKAYEEPLMQTGWRPEVTISSCPFIVDVSGLKTDDGAGPVIWIAVKSTNLNFCEDRTKDNVSVRMSEEIRGPSGEFNLSTAPDTVLNVYRKTAANSLQDLRGADGKGYLQGIPSFFEYKSETNELIFITARGPDDKVGITLNQNHAMNIHAVPRLVLDRDGNATNLENRIVNIIMNDQCPSRLVPFPNPAFPTFIHVPPGVVNLVHNPDARQWVRDEGEGIVLTSNINTNYGEVIGYLKIYDAVGNLVISRRNEQLLASSGFTAEELRNGMVDVDIYWNLSNEQGMAVAPGLYRAVLYLDYILPGGPDDELEVIIGVAR
jgi:hypothetical protein